MLSNKKKMIALERIIMSRLNFHSGRMSYEIKLLEQINSVIVSLMAQQKFEQMAGAMMMAKAICRLIFLFRT